MVLAYVEEIISFEQVCMKSIATQKNSTECNKNHTENAETEMKYIFHS